MKRNVRTLSNTSKYGISTDAIRDLQHSLEETISSFVCKNVTSTMGLCELRLGIRLRRANGSGALTP